MLQTTMQPFDSQNALAQSDAFLCPYGRLPGDVIRLVVQGELCSILSRPSLASPVKAK